MRWVWENSHVDRLRTLPQRKGRLTGVVEDIRQTIEPVGLPVAAKILTAIATDVMSAVQSRNNRPDVNEACAALQTAIARLEAVDPNLDG
jgi:hypothetical protein